jgi:glyoxylase-like metal-dependent hydrolase (beta-lactamase superfamily II)
MDALLRREGGASVEDREEYLFEQFGVERGCLGYIVASARRAAVFDPEAEMVEPMLDFVFEHGLKPAYIVDTHTHADHISGVREFKAKTTAKIVMHEKAPASCVDIRVEDGDRLEVGDLSIKFIHTPGHAKDLVSVLLPDRILTADALLIGSCGRTDLPNGNAVRQYHTLYYTYRSLPDDLLVYPGHDYNGHEHSTLKEEKTTNPKMLFDTEEDFVRYMEKENPDTLTPVYQLADALKANMA